MQKSFDEIMNKIIRLEEMSQRMSYYVNEIITRGNGEGLYREYDDTEQCSEDTSRSDNDAELVKLFE